MKALTTIFFFSLSLLSFAQFNFNPQSKKVTEKFFPDTVDGNNSDTLPLHFNTPAFLKKKGYTNYEELMVFIVNQARLHPDLVKYEFIGESQKGKKIPLLKISDENQTGEKINFWIQGGIHGNEPASTEGVLYLIDKILNDQNHREILKHVNLGIIPMANIDGYESQIRYAANGLDLNRDQTKLMVKESVYLKQAFTDFEADVALDFHEYRPFRRDYLRMGDWGMTCPYDVMFLYSANLNVPEELRIFTKEQFVEPAREEIKDLGMNPHDYFSSTQHYGEIQLSQGSLNSRSSATSYALANCISTLVEVRGVGLKRTSFARRVYTTYTVGWSYLQTAAGMVPEIKALLARTAEDTDRNAVVKFKRNVYTHDVSMIDLATNNMIDTLMVVRDAWGSKPALQRERPDAYILLPGQDSLVKKLNILGVQVTEIADEKKMNVEVYQITDYFQEKERYEGVKRQRIKTRVSAETRTIPKGAFMVPMDQPHSNFAIEVLEPEASNSFVSFDVLHTELGAELPIYRYLDKEKL